MFQNYLTPYSPPYIPSQQDLSHSYREAVSLKTKEVFLQQQTAAKEHLMRLREELYQERELCTYKLFEDADCFLCMERIDGMGKKKYSRPILNRCGISMTTFFSANCADFAYLLKWKGGVKYWFEPALSSKKLRQFLAQNGVVLICKPKQIQLASDLLLSFLCEKSQIEEIPACFGYSKNSHGKWQFCDENSINLEDLKNGKNF